MFIGPCIIAVVDECKTNLITRTQWSQSTTDSGQNQLKHAYQLQQSEKNTSHQAHTATHLKVTLMLKHPSLQNKTTDVVIHHHSRKLLKMDILMSETCWARNKWNKIASDIKLVFHSSTPIQQIIEIGLVLSRGLPTEGQICRYNLQIIYLVQRTLITSSRVSSAWQIHYHRTSTEFLSLETAPFSLHFSI